MGYPSAYMLYALASQVSDPPKGMNFCKVRIWPPLLWNTAIHFMIPIMNNFTESVPPKVQSFLAEAVIVRHASLLCEWTVTSNLLGVVGKVNHRKPHDRVPGFQHPKLSTTKQIQNGQVSDWPVLVCPTSVSSESSLPISRVVSKASRKTRIPTAQSLSLIISPPATDATKASNSIHLCP